MNFKDIENSMREIDILLSSYAQALRNTTNVVTGNTPRQMVYGYDIIMQVVIEMNQNNILKKKK